MEGTFRPHLDTFEEREVPTSISSLFPGVRQISSLASLGASARFNFTRPTFNFSHPPLASGGSAVSLFNTTSAATNVHLSVSPNSGFTFNYSVVPNQSFYGLTNQPSSVTLIPATDPGLTTPGLITPASIRANTGFSFLV